MFMIDQSYKIRVFHPEEDLDEIVDAYRKCYKLDTNMTYDEKANYISRVLARGHESPLEHSRLTVDFVTNRGITHELVRHRLISPTQESTRYCNYSLPRFGNSLIFIKDSSIEQGEQMEDWIASLKACENEYFRRLENGYSPEQARGCLSNDLKAEIKITTNYREWRHIFKLRCAPEAHYQMRELLQPLQAELHEALPFIF